MQLIVKSEAQLPSKSFDFNMILSYALMQFLKVPAYFRATQELHQSINRVLLQKTFQPTVPPVNAFFGLNNCNKRFGRYRRFIWPCRANNTTVASLAYDKKWLILSVIIYPSYIIFFSNNK